MMMFLLNALKSLKTAFQLQCHQKLAKNLSVINDKTFKTALTTVTDSQQAIENSRV
jgi:hypothetical protein